MAYLQTQDKQFSNRMNPLLYPMRSDASESYNPYNTLSCDTVLPDNTEYADNEYMSHIKWVGESPLQWIENITCMADASLDLNENEERFKSLTIETDAVGDSSSSYIPPPPPGIRRNNQRSGQDLSPTSIHYLMSIDEGRDDDDDELNLVSMDTDDGSKVVNKKRSRDSWDTDADDETTRDDVVGRCSWDIPNMPGSLISYEAMNKLQSLALSVESLSVFNLLSSSYKRIYDLFCQSSESIVYDSSLDVQTKQEHIQNLYSNTTQKLEALLSMAKNIESEKITTSGVTYSIKSAKGSESKSKRGYCKTYFTQYMNNWLINNWTNPYPDEKVMYEISAACGASSDVVSNWLINARVRKWRPAIVKAYELGRGADHLLEDSIHIFEGKPVHELPSSPKLSI